MSNQPIEPTNEEIVVLVNTIMRMNTTQLAGLSGTALGVAERRARHTTIPLDHYLTKHIPVEYAKKPR